MATAVYDTGGFPAQSHVRLNADGTALVQAATSDMGPLLEHTVTDPRDGRIVNANLADYLVPVNADIPNLKAIYLNGNDPETNPLGVKGLGEIVIVGVAPAIGNATGRRIRDFPITADALL